MGCIWPGSAQRIVRKAESDIGGKAARAQTEYDRTMEEYTERHAKLTACMQQLQKRFENNPNPQMAIRQWMARHSPNQQLVLGLMTEVHTKSALLAAMRKQMTHALQSVTAVRKGAIAVQQDEMTKIARKAMNKMTAGLDMEKAEKEMDDLKENEDDSEQFINMVQEPDYEQMLDDLLQPSDSAAMSFSLTAPEPAFSFDLPDAPMFPKQKPQRTAEEEELLQ